MNNGQTQWKDVAHLYLGCRVAHLGITGGQLIGVEDGTAMLRLFIDGIDAGRTVARLQDVKPILRPLSSMTEEEEDEALLQSGEVNNQLQALEAMGKLTHHLLQEKYDLFGLIESGQAIDATTITN